MASTILNAGSANTINSGAGSSVNTINVGAGGSGGSSGAGSSVWITSSSSTYSTGSITVPASYSITTGGTSYTTSAWSSMSSNGTQPNLTVTGNAEIEGNLKVAGRDIAKSLEAIEKRLAILVPDPEKLEHFEALKKAYDHYKLLEALCEVPKEKKE